MLGNTFTNDDLKREPFDYMLSNPPFEVDRKKVQNVIKTGHGRKGMYGRFGTGPPRINDGSLPLSQHVISKIKLTAAASGSSLRVRPC